MIKINIPFMYAYFPLMDKQLEFSKFEDLLKRMKDFTIFNYN
jgi:hypothetical protein